jgi:hypothetical protein
MGCSPSRSRQRICWRRSTRSPNAASAARPEPQRRRRVWSRRLRSIRATAPTEVPCSTTPQSKRCAHWARARNSSATWSRTSEPRHPGRDGARRGAARSARLPRPRAFIAQQRRTYRRGAVLPNLVRASGAHAAAARERRKRAPGAAPQRIWEARRRVAAEDARGEARLTKQPRRDPPRKAIPQLCASCAGPVPKPAGPSCAGRFPRGQAQCRPNSPRCR